jgi:predicted RNase H-like HicB family nuclease
MAIDMAARYVARDVEQATEAPAGAAGVQYGPFTGIAIFDGEQWAALCRELDVASIGASAQQALENLQDAVHEYIEALTQDGGDASQQRRVPDSDMRDFLLGHHGLEPVTYLTFKTP